MPKKLIVAISVLFISLSVCAFIAWCFGISFDNRGSELGNAALMSLICSLFASLLAIVYLEIES